MKRMGRFGLGNLRDKAESLKKRAIDSRVGRAAGVVGRAATAAGATALLGPLATVMGPLLGLMAFVQTLHFVVVFARMDSAGDKAKIAGLLAAGAAFSAVIGIVLPAILNAILPILIAGAAVGSVAKDTNVLDKIRNLKKNIVEKIKAKLISIKDKAANGDIKREDGINAAKEVLEAVVTEVKPGAVDVNAQVDKKEAEIEAKTNEYTREVNIDNVDNLENTIKAKDNEIKSKQSRFGKIMNNIRDFFRRGKKKTPPSDPSAPSAPVVVNAEPLPAQPQQENLPVAMGSVSPMNVGGGRRRTKKRRGGKRKRRRKTKRKGRKKTKKRRKLKKRKTKKRR